MSETKIMIAVPCMDMVPAQFASSLAMLQKGDNITAVAFQISSLVWTARDALATKAIQSDADYILWLDSDMVFDPDTLLRLLGHAAPDTIVTGMYFRRVQPYSPVLYDKLEIDEGGKVETEQTKEIPEGLQEKAGCGFGCVLTPVDAFVEVIASCRQLFAPITGLGEDLSFCWRARQCGYKILVDPSIPLGHVGYQVITKPFFEAFRRQNDTRDIGKD